MGVNCELGNKMVIFKKKILDMPFLLMEQKIVMYTDGGSRDNPGPAAVGVYIETLHKQYGHYIGEKTNNEAEYGAVIFGLKKIPNMDCWKTEQNYEKYLRIQKKSE